MEATTEVIEVKNEGLEKVLADSKLETSEAEKIKQSYLPYFEQLQIIKEEAKKINYENPSALDEKIARDLRLRTVKVRTGSESVKEERKRIYMLRANVEQQAWNLIKSNCQLDEEIFLQVEKKREIAEAKRKADLKLIRETEIASHGLSEFIPSIINLGELSDEDYIKLHAGANMQLQQRQEAQAKAELERIAREKTEAEERERQRLENIRLKQAEQKRLDEIAAQNKIRKERFAGREKQLLDLGMKKAGCDYVSDFTSIYFEQVDSPDNDKWSEYVKFVSDLKAKHEAKIAEQEAAAKQAAKEKAAAEAKLKAEKEAREKAERELKAKADAEAKAKRDAELKAAEEERARVAAAKKAMAAPDKIKLETLANEFLNVALPEMKTDEGKAILTSVNDLVSKLSKFIREKAEAL